MSKTPLIPIARRMWNTFDRSWSKSVTVMSPDQFQSARDPSEGGLPSAGRHSMIIFCRVVPTIGIDLIMLGAEN